MAIWGSKENLKALLVSPLVQAGRRDSPMSWQHLHLDPWGSLTQVTQTQGNGKVKGDTGTAPEPGTTSNPVEPVLFVQDRPAIY